MSSRTSQPKTYCGSLRWPPFLGPPRKRFLYRGGKTTCTAFGEGPLSVSWLSSFLSNLNTSGIQTPGSLQQGHVREKRLSIELPLVHNPYI